MLAMHFRCILSIVDCVRDAAAKAAGIIDVEGVLLSQAERVSSGSVATVESTHLMEESVDQEKPNMAAGGEQVEDQIDVKKVRYPHCIVWTPIPLLTWLFPFIGHMGICYSTGVVRDFAGPYYVSEDDMAFGKPTRYLKLDQTKIEGNWDRAIYEASEEYKTRTHKLICDNCHSHVAMSLNLMKYRNMTTWNMIYLAALVFVAGRYVGVGGFIKTWLPSVILYTIIIVLCTVRF